MQKLLQGITVLDIGRYVAGPYCATLLGYFGATVIRVERLSGGEDRFISPLSDDVDGTAGTGGLFMQTGCGKKSVTLDLSKEEGRAVLRRLATSVDVVVANLPARALEKLGLDWPTFTATNPTGILVTQSSFGSSGPGRDKGGFDGVGQALSGAMYLTGHPDAPVKAATPYVDYATALFSVIGTLGALRHRDQTGEGQHVEATLLGTALAALNAHLAEQAVTGKNRVGTGNRVQTSAPSDVFATKDGHVLVHTVGNGLFKRWATLVGQPELAEDPRFSSDQSRGDHRDELCTIMAGWCAERTTAEALDGLEGAGVPTGPVQTLQQALDDPLTAALDLFENIAVPGLDATAPVARVPLQFSAGTPPVPGRPPELGEHTASVLADFGYSADEITALEALGVIGPSEN